MMLSRAPWARSRHALLATGAVTFLLAVIGIGPAMAGSFDPAHDPPTRVEALEPPSRPGPPDRAGAPPGADPPALADPAPASDPTTPAPTDPAPMPDRAADAALTSRRDFGVPALLVATLGVYLLVQRRLDRGALPMRAQTSPPDGNPAHDRFEL